MAQEASRLSAQTTLHVLQGDLQPSHEFGVLLRAASLDLAGLKGDATAGAFGLRTILFTDVENSTDLTDHFGDARARDLLREHERLTREALAAHGGTEIKTMDDGFMASFSSASGALDAAIAMQLAIAAHFADTEAPIRIRVGINAGEPIEEDDDLYGTAVIQAARVMGKAEGGEIFVTDTVRNLVAGKNYRFHDQGAHESQGLRGAGPAVRGRLDKRRLTRSPHRVPAPPLACVPRSRSCARPRRHPSA